MLLAVGDRPPAGEFDLGIGKSRGRDRVVLIDVERTSHPRDVEVVFFFVHQDHAMAFDKDVAVGQGLFDDHGHRCGQLLASPGLAGLVEFCGGTCRNQRAWVDVRVEFFDLGHQPDERRNISIHLGHPVI